MTLSTGVIGLFAKEINNTLRICGTILSFFDSIGNVFEGIVILWAILFVWVFLFFLVRGCVLVGFGVLLRGLRSSNWGIVLCSITFCVVSIQ